MRKAKRIDCDVLIAGGGLVGSAAAVALADLPIGTVLVESRDPAALEQPSFDARVTALANGSQRILAGLGVWEAIRDAAQPITEIHVSERGRLGAARIVARREGVPALGYTIENRTLAAALWGALGAARGVETLAPARLDGIAAAGDRLEARVEQANGTVRTVRARVVLAADGVDSVLRAALDIPATCDDYGQSAIVFNCEIERVLAGLAFERFTPEGPLAILPLPGQRVGVVWTLATTHAERVMACSDAELRMALDRAVGGRLGAIGRLGRRALHALYRVRSERVIAARVALIGSAAVSLHPVAGQGFNLALRDVAALAEAIADTLAAGEADVGRADMLERYADWRRHDQAAVARFTHALIRLFGARVPGLGVARGAGLAAFDLVPGAKSSLARLAMGYGGRLPRLACGRALRE